MTTEASCGTRPAYMRHVRRGEEIDDACRAAQKEYFAQWRKENPDAAKEARRRKKVRNRALSRLAQMHPMDFALLEADEAQKEGVPL